MSSEQVRGRPAAAAVIAPAAVTAGPAGSHIELRPVTSERRWQRALAHRYVAILSRIAVPVLILVLWQLGYSNGFISAQKLESPSAVFSALKDLQDTGALWPSIAISLRRAGLGFLYGGSVGLVLGLICGLSRVGERALDALLQMLRTIPFLAVIPLFVIWFGIGELPKELLIAISCVFPIYLNTFAGVRNVDTKIVEAASVFGLRPLRLATGIVFPLALPTILVGIRYSLGTSLLALVAAEQVNATSGIGYLALSPQAALRPDIVLAVVAIYAVFGLCIDLIIRLVTRIALPWHRTLVERTR
jgi:sulfonate transport system permease protein